MHLIKGVLLLLLATGAGAEPLADMAGTWRGAGWARETPTGPPETLRCQITNSYEAASLTLTLNGTCVVPGRKLNMAGKLTGQAGKERITGRWFNPDGLGSTRITGAQRDNVVVFAFTAKRPDTGRDLSQSVEWRLSDGQLHFRAVDRTTPGVQMADIVFTK